MEQQPVTGFRCQGGDEVGHHISPTNMPVTQETKRDIIYVLGNNGMGLDIYTIK